MKILQVLAFFSPVHGGSAMVPYYLSKELAKKGHDVTIYTSDYKLSREWVEELRQLKVRVLCFRAFTSVAKFYLTPGLVNVAKKDIKDFDIIHLHNYRTFQNIIVCHNARKYGVPYILQAHGSLPSNLSRQKLKRFYDFFWGKKLLQDAAKVIAVTKKEVEQYRDFDLPIDKIEIIPNGINLSDFEKLPEPGIFRRKYNLANDEKIILFLGRIDKTKGIDLLVKAFVDVLKEIAKAKLVIVGPDDGYLPSIKRIINELEIQQHVLVIGPLYGKGKLEAYVDSDVYVLPSYYETFPVSILEASACRVPVITTNNCGIADIVKDQLGFVVSCNLEELKNEIVYLLSNNQARIEFGRIGRKLIFEKFTWPKIAEQVEKVYLRSLRRS